MTKSQLTTLLGDRKQMLTLLESFQKATRTNNWAQLAALQADITDLVCAPLELTSAEQPGSGLVEAALGALCAFTEPHLFQQPLLVFDKIISTLPCSTRGWKPEVRERIIHLVGPLDYALRGERA